MIDAEQSKFSVISSLLKNVYCRYRVHNSILGNGKMLSITHVVDFLQKLFRNKPVEQNFSE